MNAKVVEMAQFRSSDAPVKAAALAKPMSAERVARIAQRLANVREELLELQKELDAERKDGATGAGMHHASLGYTLLDIDRVTADLYREYGSR